VAFCAKCGSEVAPGVGFCPKCGAPQSVASQPAAAPVYTAPTGAPAAGMQENVAGLLCYVLGWVTGLIFFLIDKRPFVRFHAAQSIVTFGGLQIIGILLVFLHFGSIFGGVGMFGILALLHFALWLVTVILWIVCMVKAYQGQLYRVPIAAGFADQLVGKQV